MKYTLTGIALAFVAIIALLFSINTKVGISQVASILGGTGDANQATTTDQTMLTATQFQLLKNGPGVLHTVVITLSTATAFNLYDATTTTSHANYATTTIAKFGTSVAAGTYTFDVAFARGLIIEFPVGQVTVASSTITTN